MYNINRVIKKLTPHRSAAELFKYFSGEKDCVFLDSSLVNGLGRYSIIGVRPYLKLVKDDHGFFINEQKVSELSFEEYLKKYLSEHKDQNKSGLPMLSGAIGYFSYEYGRKLMEIPSHKENLVTIPDAVLVFYDMYIIEDCHEKKTFLVANGVTEDAEKLIESVEKRLTEVLLEKEQVADGSFNIEITPNFKKEENKKPLDVFYDLRENNPSPFGGYMDYGDFQIVCASPERFLKMKKGHVNTRPIKGTRKRGETLEEDLLMRNELKNSEKDKSELLMIVDLERNDLNRVCKPGSVKVTELFTVEEYATVFHLVSDIEGVLQENKTIMDLLEATFPGGSITGAPKYRAMEIIDELENNRRNLYTGSIGYLTLDGDCDFNIVIRTALHKDGMYYLGVGGGITAESDLEFEYEETLQKAKAVLEAMK